MCLQLFYLPLINSIIEINIGILAAKRPMINKRSAHPRRYMMMNQSRSSRVGISMLSEQRLGDKYYEDTVGHCRTL